MSDAQATGAIHPEKVTHGFALNDSRWLFAMLHIEDETSKIIENRAFRMTPGWYAVSLSERAATSVVDEVEFRRAYPSYPGPMAYQKGRVLGLVRVGHSLPHSFCNKSEWADSTYEVCNIITEVLPFAQAGPKVRANFGTFPLKEAVEPTREAVVRAVAAPSRRRKTHGKTLHPEVLDVWDTHRVRPPKPDAGTDLGTKAVAPTKKAGRKRSAEAAGKGKAPGRVDDAAQPPAGAPASAPPKRAKAPVKLLKRPSPSSKAPPPSAPAVASPGDIRRFLR